MKSLQESILDTQGIEKDLKDEFALILSILDKDNPKIDNAIDGLIEWAKKNAVQQTVNPTSEDGQRKGVYIIHNINQSKFRVILQIVYFSGHDQKGIFIRQAGHSTIFSTFDMRANAAFQFTPSSVKHHVYYLGDNSKYEKILLDKIKQMQ